MRKGQRAPRPDEAPPEIPAALRKDTRLGWTAAVTGPDFESMTEEEAIKWAVAYAAEYPNSGTEPVTQMALSILAGSLALALEHIAGDTSG